MRKREPVASFDRWTLLRIKDFVDVDSAGLQPNGPEDVRFNAKSIAWNTKQAVQIIEIDPKLEMLFDDVLDANRRLHLQPCGLGILRKQAAARHRPAAARLVSRPHSCRGSTPEWQRTSAIGRYATGRIPLAAFSTNSGRYRACLLTSDADLQQHRWSGMVSGDRDCVNSSTNRAISPAIVHALLA
jgi:hypothetical protein